jgi:putative hemolysin
MLKHVNFATIPLAAHDTIAIGQVRLDRACYCWSSGTCFPKMEMHPFQRVAGNQVPGLHRSALTVDSVREDPISTVSGLVAVALLLLANGFFVATEFALVSVRRSRIQQRSLEGDPRASGILNRLDHLDISIAATQVGISACTLAIGLLGTPVLARVLEPALVALPFGMSDATLTGLSIAVAFLLLVAVHVVLGELTPRSIGLERPISTSLVVARPIRRFALVLRPIIEPLNWLSERIIRLMGIEPAAGHQLVLTTDELMLSIDASREAGIVDEAAHDLVGRAFVFTDLEARHVMVPRTEVSAIPVDATLEDVIDLLARTPYTRIPVYDGDADNIVGIIKSKRLLPVFLQKLSALRKATGENLTMEPEIPFDLRDYMLEPILVPETLPATDVLAQMRETHSQLAVVIDEYGGTAGIVTLKDIVTQLVGRIRDEEDDPAEPSLAPNGDLHLDGLIGLSELREEYGIDLTDEDVDVETLGGYVFYRLGRPGAVGDRVTSDVGYIFSVEEMDGLRVSRVGVHPAMPAESIAA